ncbi:MAG: SGNH/GDSL hydrolase family protein [Verrucomicrobiia bacterium]
MKLIDKTFRFLIVQVVLIFFLAVYAGFSETTNRWENEIRAFELCDLTNKPPENCILFIGSSSIRLWKTLKEDFPQLPVVNRGFGGSQIADSVYFAERIVFPYKPRLIIMYAGANDIAAGKSPEEVFNDFKTFVRKVHSHLPSTRIGFIAMSTNPARWNQVEKVKQGNKLIREFTLRDPRLFFIDTFSHMLNNDGTPKSDIFVEDKLHMNKKGYEIWKNVIRPYLN